MDNPDVLKLFHRHKDFCFSQSKWYSSLFLYWFNFTMLIP